MPPTNNAFKSDVHAFMAFPAGTLLIGLLSTRDAVKDLYRDQLSQHDLTEQQWRVLTTLWSVDHLDATRLAEQTALLPSSLTRILHGLEKRGLISARRAPDDARRTELRLSTPGKTLMKSLEPDIIQIENRIVGAIGARRFAQLMKDLDHARDALEKSPKSGGLRRKEPR